jgi:hypothetical protein
MSLPIQRKDARRVLPVSPESVSVTSRAERSKSLTSATFFSRAMKDVVVEEDYAGNNPTF